MTIEGGMRYPSGNKPLMVNSCVKRFGADLKVPSMIQLSESTMVSALHSVPHSSGRISWYLESHSIMYLLSVSYNITQTLSSIEPTGYPIMSVYYVGSRVNQETDVDTAACYPYIIYHCFKHNFEYNCDRLSDKCPFSDSCPTRTFVRKANFSCRTNVRVGQMS